MDINNIFTKGLDVNEALELLRPMSVYVLCMAAYAIFVFKFYRFVASRDVFAWDLSRYEDRSLRRARSSLHVVLYVLKYLILFPVIAFFWFVVLTLILTFLSRGRIFSETLLIALATVSVIRVTAYYKEALSKDLSKILPFGVLAAFLIDGSFFSVDESLESLKDAKSYSEHVLYYLVFLIVLEFALRLLMGVTRLIGGSRSQRWEQRAANQRDESAGPSQPDAWDPAAAAPSSGGAPK